MPDENAAKRAEAFKIFKETGGIIGNVDLSRMLGVQEKTISAWKSRDKWNERLKEESVEVTTNLDERAAKRKEVIDKLNEIGTYSPGLDFLIEMYLDAYEDYKMTRSDKIRREVVRYLAQLGLDAKGLKKKSSKVDMDKEKDVDVTKSDNKLLQFRQRNVGR